MSKWRPNSEKNIYVIPDVHGCADQLHLILDRITPLREQDKIVFLGDYCDRGPKSPEVLDICISLNKKFNTKDRKIIFIRGNHDQLLLSIAGQTNLGFNPNLPSDYSTFINNGGDVTIQQYAARKGVEIKNPKELRIDRAISFIDTNHLDFLEEETETVAQIDDYIFCHGGYDVYESIDKQDNDILMWDRSLYSTVKKIISEGKKLPWADKMTIVTGHNYDGPFVCSGFMMLDCSVSLNKLLVVELNSMEAFTAEMGHNRLVKYNLKEY